jgi:protein arginine N-methyltransferase 1
MQQMLKDKVRTDSYRDAIMGNPGLFAGKTVLDIGCGTGILSIFAARAGAARVIGIDNSGIVTKARRIVAENGLADKITIVRGRVEDLPATLPGGVTQVDVIVSEWMGYFLFYESMLDTVLFARNQWLAPGGSVLPDQAGLYLVALDYSSRYEEHITFWRDVYGVDMSCVTRDVFVEPQVEIVDPSHVVSSPCILKNSNMLVMTAADVDLMAKPFELVVRRAGPIHVRTYFYLP